MHIVRIPNCRSLNKINMIVNPLPGSEIGIPLYFLEKTFTNLHYGIDINNKELFLFQSMVGFFTYGTDRLLDSINTPDDNKELNIYFRKNKKLLGILLLISYGFIIKDLYSKKFKPNVGGLRLKYFWL